MTLVVLGNLQSVLHVLISEQNKFKDNLCKMFILGFNFGKLMITYQNCVKIQGTV